MMKLPLNSYLYNITILIGVNIILAVSLNLVNGYTGLFSLGHAGFMAVGAYASAAVTNLLGPKILARRVSRCMHLHAVGGAHYCFSRRWGPAAFARHLRD